MTASLFERNRAKLADQLGEDGLLIIFAARKMPRNGDQFFPFRQNSDFYYLTGIQEEDSILLLSESYAHLFISEPSEQVTLWEGTRLDPSEARKISGVENISWIHEFDKILEQQTVAHKTVYFNVPEKISPQGIHTKDEIYLRDFREACPFHTIRSIKPVMRQLRLIKEPEELDTIKQAIEITNKAFHRVLRQLKPGMPERTIQAEITHELLIHQASGFAFDPIVASGKNATTLHYTSNNGICEQGELLLMDFGAEVQNYAADISRTIPVDGQFTKRQRQCYQAVLDVMQKVMKEIRPGKTLEELNGQVSQALVEKHLELGLYNQKELTENGTTVWKKYFPHGVSHFMGLDVHDTGDKKTVLEKGMVITWEPGLYIPEEQTGIRIEDDILVDDKPVNLSADIPRDPDQIESIMNERTRE